MDQITVVKNIMTEFASSTGLSNQQQPPRRYLWTDAFAVCNFLELFSRTGDRAWQQMALDLVNQVHDILGRHRDDDSRTGWINGLTEEEGRQHPTRGGLRIGKSLNERRPDQAFDERLEWERDGQYFHYLTRWMHALDRVSRVTKDPIYHSWAVALAKGAHSGFVHSSTSGSKRMFWKMSIDLSYPLVPSMGHHDPLDGLVTYHQLMEAGTAFSDSPVPELRSEIADMEALCEGRNWTTDDPLGIGGMLVDALKVSQLIVRYHLAQTDLLRNLLESSLTGLGVCMGGLSWKLPAENRLAFRELGLAIGLHAVERISSLVEKNTDKFDTGHVFGKLIDRFRPYDWLSKEIVAFWMDSQHQGPGTWADHLDINRVMLATGLIPDGYLGM
jgi:hypothetical protein